MVSPCSCTLSDFTFTSRSSIAPSLILIVSGFMLLLTAMCWFLKPSILNINESPASALMLKDPSLALLAYPPN